jgi:hypothetical protein
VGSRASLRPHATIRDAYRVDRAFTAGDAVADPPAAPRRPASVLSTPLLLPLPQPGQQAPARAPPRPGHPWHPAGTGVGTWDKAALLEGIEKGEALWAAPTRLRMLRQVRALQASSPLGPKYTPNQPLPYAPNQPTGVPLKHVDTVDKSKPVIDREPTGMDGATGLGGHCPSAPAPRGRRGGTAARLMPSVCAPAGSLKSPCLSPAPAADTHIGKNQHQE